MIPQHIVSNIIETAQIEEVVGDFVSLKKRGSNYVANCPFHNERTPSFSVSPSKGIFKCFGCGKAGNSVGFVMEHETVSYPEALRYLAKKYNIEIPEITDDKQLEEQKERESLFIVNDFANQYFQNNLYHTDEGKSVGLSYFKERGFRDEIIQKFQLGYSMEASDDLLKAAKKKGYRLGFLKKLGLMSSRNGRDFSFFRGRVQFPIHNLSGKVIAFAGRTLRKDKKIPKYINSPETDIYNKSKILYGIYFARKSIRQKDECFLVEGYTDVLSLVQAGVENVVASSGTSLTQEQIRLVKRYTSNITILYDGDEAGIKAAIRGVDLVLEEGLNVKVALLPDGEDPDSFIQKMGKTGFDNYIKEKAKDFIFFKTDLLLKETENDPVKKAALVRNIIQTLAKIPDPIKRALYVKECSKLLEVSERMIINETNKIKWTNIKKGQDGQPQQSRRQGNMPPPSSPPDDFYLEQQQGKTYEPTLDRPRELVELSNELHERDLVRVLLEYGQKEIEIDVPVAAYVVNEVEELPFEKQIYRTIVEHYRAHLEEGRVLDSDFFVSHENEEISRLAASIICDPYQLSENWEKMHQIFITEAVLLFKEEVFNLMNRYKLRHVMKMIDENLQNIKDCKTEADIRELQETHMQLLNWQKQLAQLLKTAVVR